MRIHMNRHTQSGYNLMEVVIGIFVFTVGMLALSSLQGALTRSMADAKARTAATNAAELSWVRYDGGRTSYLEVLDLQRSLFSSQLRASETMQLQLTSIVRLYQALGGGWVAEQDAADITGDLQLGE